MASADRQLHDWEDYIMGKRLTDETSGEDVRPPELPFPPQSLWLTKGAVELTILDDLQGTAAQGDEGHPRERGDRYELHA